ncbi:response regulator [Leptospira sp. GIMC2001]|uniref:response regulator n=1 Tax=Leptospira sp. GIMC2001 TaxID=1513297 RepID=UPI00234BDA70|nr:response regulator [Leptospira sp. GIMC2001]WCL49785.1 response regulator [Leptospira sp. GIMC2001]
MSEDLKTTKILLVEDETFNALLMEHQLRKIGFELIYHVSTGEDAIFTARLENPDLVIMDIRLAGEMDGIEASTIILQESKVPILFVTGYDDELIRLSAKKLDPIGYLLKPIDMNELKSILLSLFNQ